MRVVLALIVVAIAYGVGWMSDATLNDPCVGASGREIDRYDHVQRWFPVRTDCQVTQPSGATRIESGSSEVFLAMFPLALVAGFALLSRRDVALRAAAVLVAGLGAFLVIFVV
jgi:hypothetical protein